MKLSHFEVIQARQFMQYEHLLCKKNTTFFAKLKLKV